MSTAAERPQWSAADVRRARTALGSIAEQLEATTRLLDECIARAAHRPQDDAGGRGSSAG